MHTNMAAPLALRILVPDFRFVLDCGPLHGAHSARTGVVGAVLPRAPPCRFGDRDAANGNPRGVHTLDVCPRKISFVCLAKQ